MSKLKKILIIQSSIIIVLLIFLSYSYKTQENADYKTGLLSPRVYSGILQEKSYLITNFEPLIKDLSESLVENVSVYIENLRDGASFGIRSAKKFFPLSLSKVPLAILIMQKVDEGKLNLDTLIRINDESRNSLYGDLYNSSKKELPLRVLMEKMLSESDNTAFFILLSYLDQKDLKLLLDYYPIDFKFYYLPENNTETLYITPKQYSNVFRSLYLSTLLTSKSSEYILTLLKDNILDIRKSSDLPGEVVIAHKFGYYSAYGNKSMHNCGIMYIPESSRVLYCIMTTGLDDQESMKSINTTLNKTYNYMVHTRSELDQYK